MGSRRSFSQFVVPHFSHSERCIHNILRFARGAVVASMLFASLVVGGSVGAQTIDHSAGFTTSSDLTSNGAAAFVSGDARLVNGGFHEAGSVFSNSLVNVSQFTNTFEFQTTAATNTADGITFCVQGNSPTALGGASGEMGFGPAVNDNPGIPSSTAVKFDLYQNTGVSASDPSSDCMGVFYNGVQPYGGIDLTPYVNLHDGDIFSVSMVYNGTLLNTYLRDTTTGAWVYYYTTVTFPGTADYVGFTSSTASYTSTANILNWKFVSTTTPAAVPTPTITPASESFTGSVAVSIAETLPFATIYYTTDGSTPTTSSTKYTTAFTISSIETVKAIAVAPAYSNSAVASASYTTGSPIVTNTDDSGTGSLRAAVTYANEVPGTTITFASGLTGTITLLSTLPTLTAASTTIQGPGLSTLAISGGNDVRLMEIASGAATTISGLTLGHGHVAGSTGGMAILNDGTLTINNCALISNTTAGSGGAIDSVGPATISGCTFTNNTAIGGGAVALSDGGTVTGCTFIGNSSGAANTGGALIASGTFSLTDSTFASNILGGAVAASGTSSISSCTFTGNTDVSGTTAIYNAGVMTVAGCTVTGNNGKFAALDNLGTLTLIDDILYGNATTEIIDGTTTDAVTGTTAVKHCDIDVNIDNSDTISDDGGNIDVNPQLGTLASNGGDAETMALLTGSPCFGAGTATGAPSTDERGIVRPSPPSMGAFDIAQTNLNILWNHAPDDEFSLWSVTGLTPTFKAYGPFGGWQSIAVATGPDGVAHILQVHTSDGQISIWNVNANYSYTYQAYGPYAGWQASDITVTPNNHVRILWTYSDGTISLWDMASATSISNPTYSPSAGWTATHIAAGPDGHIHLLLNHTADNEAGVWDLASATSFTYAGFGPTVGWAAKSIAISADNHTHLLWVRAADNAASVWDMTSFTSYTQPLYGPYPGWAAQSIATTADNEVHVAWTNSVNALSIWDMASETSLTFRVFAGATGWELVGMGQH